MDRAAQRMAGLVDPPAADGWIGSWKGTDGRRLTIARATGKAPGHYLVSVWTQQCYAKQMQNATRLLSKECDEVAAYLVTEDGHHYATPGMAFTTADLSQNHGMP